MSALFLLSAYWNITHWNLALEKMARTGVGNSDILLIAATLALALGGISLLLGFKTRLGAFLLILEVVTAAVIFHPFWAVPQLELMTTLLQFLNRLGLCGGLVILLGIGAGRFSFDGQ